MSLAACPECEKEISKNAKACPNCGAELDSQIVQAAESGDLQKVKSLLDDGSAINSVDWDGFTALMAASAGGHVEIVKLLVERGADPNAINSRAVDERTALMAASLGGHIEIVKLLVERGADPHVADGWGKTALSVASRQGHYQVVKFLIESVDGWEDESLSQALHEASTGQVVKFLLESVDTWQDGDVRSALQSGIANDWRDLVSVLVEQVGVNGSIGLGTPLIAAAQYDKPEIAGFLLDNGADIDARAGTSKKGGHVYAEMTALQVAVKWGHAEMIRLLLERGADLESGIEGSTWSPLLEAAQQGNIEVVRLFLKYGADINAQLLLRGVVEELCSESPPLFPIGDGGSLCPVAKPLLVDMIKFLLANGADVNAQGTDGRTPLMRVCEVGEIDLARLFLEKGADPNIKSTASGVHSGENAMGFALIHDHYQIVELVKQYGGKKTWWKIYVKF